MPFNPHHFSEAFCSTIHETGHALHEQGLLPNNGARPGLTRVHADDVAYNPHVLPRFELELALFRGDLNPAFPISSLETGAARIYGL